MADIEGLRNLPASKVTPGWMSITPAVTRSEKCWSLEELNVKGQRWQIIVVNRADSLAACYRPMGQAATKVKEFAWLCGFDHSVGEALDWAEDQREDTYWEEFLAEKVENSTLIKDFHDQVEEKYRIQQNQSTFGPGGKVERSGYHRKRK